MHNEGGGGNIHVIKKTIQLNYSFFIVRFGQYMFIFWIRFSGLGCFGSSVPDWGVLDPVFRIGLL